VTDVPRRLRPSPEQRQLTANKTHTTLSASGSVASARPVNQQPANVPRFQPPTTIATDRLSVGYRVDDPTLITASPFYIPGWTFIEEASGTSVFLRDPDDGGIYLGAPGVYSVHMWMKAVGIEAAAASCSIRAFCDVAEPFATSFDVGVRGGDGADGRQIFASTSRTYYDLGEGLAGGLSPGIGYANLDTVNVTQILVEVHVQRVS
jgi:hypothetical protein